MPVPMIIKHAENIPRIFYSSRAAGSYLEPVAGVLNISAQEKNISQNNKDLTTRLRDCQRHNHRLNGEFFVGKNKPLKNI